MAESSTFTFNDPDSYAAAFGGPRVNLTITGAGGFRATLSRLNMKQLEVYWLRENLPRIAYLTLPPGRIFLSFPVGRHSPIFAGFACQSGDIVLHSRGGQIHQRSSGECQWGLVSISPLQLDIHAKALMGQPIASPDATRILRPVRAEALRFKRLFRQACRLIDTRTKLIERPEVALEQELLYEIIYCLAAKEADDNPKTRHHHVAARERREGRLIYAGESLRLLQKRLPTGETCPRSV